MAAAKGNNYRKQGQDWLNALRNADLDRSRLLKVAEMVYKKALAGEAWAVQEIANRMDGKPVQPLKHSGDEDDPVVIHAIERRIVKPDANPED